jgi:multicomponent Na+:H+ antiporter subunit G
MTDIIIQACCLAASVAILLASLGLLRFPDFFTRAHAATKASAFGLAALVLAACVAFPQANVLVKAVFAIIALFITLPVASQALADAVRKKDEAQQSAPQDGG